MKALTPDTLRRAIEKKRGGVYFLFGDEEYLKERALAMLLDAHLDPATRDFNYDQVRGGDVTPETLASLLATPPMMAEWRVVVLKDVQALATNARMRSTLESLLEKPMPGVLFIMTAQIPSGRAQFYETLKKRATPVECAGLSDADAPGWLIERASEAGYELAVDAARGLAGAVGTDLGILTRELEKLCGYVGDRRRITKADVEAAVGQLPRQDRWAWFDLVGDQRFREARSGLHILLDAGESGVGILIGLGTHFLRLALAAHGGQRALESALPPNQKWLAGRVSKQARRWTPAALDNCLEELLRADRLLKSGGLNETQIMEELMLRIQAHAAEPVAA